LVRTDFPTVLYALLFQDSALVKRLSSVLTRRVLRFFDGEARRDATRYNQKFFHEFGQFLKEGAVSDATYAPDIAKLLRFESSALPAGTLTSFDEYVSRMPPGQKDIYYLVAPHRGIAEASPYMEAFKGASRKLAASVTPDVVVAADAAEAAAVPPLDAPASDTEPHVDDVEVLFLYSSIDDGVMNSTREFSGRRLVTAEAADVNPETLKGLKPGAGTSATDAAASDASVAARLTDAQVEELGAWLVQVLPTRLSKVCCRSIDSEAASRGRRWELSPFS
jgi:TNF receptor-associated protein 1